MSHTYRPMPPHRARPRDGGALVCVHCGAVVPILVRGAPLRNGDTFTGCLDCQTAHDAAPVRVPASGSGKERDA